MHKWLTLLASNSPAYLLRRTRRPTITTFFLPLTKASIETAPEASGDVQGGDAEVAGCLGGGEVLAVA